MLKYVLTGKTQVMNWHRWIFLVWKVAQRQKIPGTESDGLDNPDSITLAQSERADGLTSKELTRSLASPSSANPVTCAILSLSIPGRICRQLLYHFGD